MFCCFLTAPKKIFLQSVEKSHNERQTLVFEILNQIPEHEFSVKMDQKLAWRRREIWWFSSVLVETLNCKYNVIGSVSKKKISFHFVWNCGNFIVIFQDLATKAC